MIASVIERSFWDIKYKEASVSNLWTGCLSHDFEQMSANYHRAGSCILRNVINNRSDNFTCDFVFPAAVYMCRHAIELAMKALVCASNDNRQISECFQKDKHDIEAIFRRCEQVLRSSSDSSDVEWFVGFVYSANHRDPNADYFRYPPSPKTNRSFSIEPIDIDDTSKTLMHAYAIVSNAFGGGEQSALAYKASENYFSTIGSGIGNCMIDNSATSAKYYYATEGYSAAAETLYEDPNMSWREKCFPLLFLLRHTIELELKYLTCARNTINAAGGHGHRFKKLWSVPETILRQRAINSGWDLSLLDTVNRQLQELSALDKNGFLFRYPVDKSMEHKLPCDSVLDVKSIYEYQTGIISFLSGCNSVIDEMEDHESELHTECNW